MRVLYQINPKVTVEASGDNHKAIFKELASLQEVFGVAKCGACDNTEGLTVTVRNVDDNDFYEMRCPKCRAKLSYGQSKTGGSLYPRRKYHDKHPDVKAGKASEGDWLPNDGWEVWTPQHTDETPKKGKR